MSPMLKPVAKSLTELVALRAETHPDKIAIHTGAAEFGDEIKSLSFLDMRKAIDRLCEHYASIGVQVQSQDVVPPTQTIAVLTSSSIEETLLELCCIKLGFTPLLLSVNNSAAAVAHLCRVTGAKQLIFESKYQDTADEAKTILEGQAYRLDLIPEKRFPLWGEGGVRNSEVVVFPARLRPEDETTRPCVILHSSGSTGFPKPVSITHASLLAMAAIVPSGNGFSGVPVYHAFGHFNVIRAFCHADPVTLLPPHLPATAANIMRIIKASPSPPQHLYAVPYVLKLLAETEAGMNILASMETVSSAGAAMPDELGDRMVEAGAPLVSFYGTTETGGIMSSLRDCKVDKAWNWLRAEGPVAKYLEFAPQGSGTFEVIVKDGWPPKIMANREDGAYCTKDLVVQHPEHPTWYKYIGRMDDTLTQTLGEKTNPVPIELAIRGNSPLVAECIVFGDARPQVGALILPSDAGAELSKDKEAFLDAIWPVVLEANARAPSHSRLLRDMIEILPYGTEVPLAPKLTIIRPACYAKFADIINAVYERFELGTTGPKRKIDNQEEMEAYLVDVITKVLGPKVSDALNPSTDLFALGVDSLQATTVRNVLFKTLELGDAQLGQNVVYEHPSVRQLASFLLDIGSGRSNTEQSTGSSARVLAMVDKWSAQLVDRPAHPKEVINGSTGEVVVLTGATGSLGAHILVQLLRKPEVHKVICLSRAESDKDSLQRIHDSLSRRLCSIDDKSRDKIVSYAADVNVPNLGLTPEVYDTLRREATAIIHNAWPVNFVLSIESFDEHIGGAVNLLNLTLASPRSKKPAFFFSSSVASSLDTQDAVVPEAFSESPQAATMGYGQSKWVVEKICERAAETTNARTGILRIGQLVGDTEHGVWNETEAWPLMFKAANSTGVMPLLEDEKLLWLPVDQAAQAIVEVVSSQTEAKSAVYHVLNPRSGNWKDVLQGLKAGGLRFETVGRTEWIKRLAASDPDVANNPSYKLLGFYQSNFGTKHAKSPPDFSVEKTCGVSPTIAKTEPISADLVALWTKHWRRTGFLQ